MDKDPRRAFLFHIYYPWRFYSISTNPDADYHPTQVSDSVSIHYAQLRQSRDILSSERAWSSSMVLVRVKCGPWVWAMVRTRIRGSPGAMTTVRVRVRVIGL